jgi:cytochrome c biogenesis protein CcmG, thiol:disulfide interchange protein DsbE
MKAARVGGGRRGRMLLAAAVLGGCAQFMPCQAQSRQGALVGKPAPAFSLQGIYGETYSLDQFKGHILVMQFGSSW